MVRPSRKTPVVPSQFRRMGAHLRGAQILSPRSGTADFAADQPPLYLDRDGPESAAGSDARQHPHRSRAPRPSRRTDRSHLCSGRTRSEEHTSELQSLMRISYDVFCLKKTKTKQKTHIKY